MFTGIIEQQGVVTLLKEKTQSVELGIKSDFDNLVVGESIAINGVCLTLLPESIGSLLLFDVSPETLSITTFGLLSVGSTVNLERAMLASTRFGGHYVSGHVDTTAMVMNTAWVSDEYFEICLGGFSLKEKLYLLPKGSITINGVSLTINFVSESNTDIYIKLLLVPHTLAHTSLGQCQAGDRLNVELDYLTRIVAHQLRIINNDSGI